MSETIKFSDPKDNTTNTPELLAAHLAETGGKVVTRFPPEPNAYLHLGHAKAMNLSYGYAKKMGGICYQRLDDTNPESGKQEFADSIVKSVKWLGFEPVKVTYASDHFDALYDFAVKLIEKGKAYVCSLSSEECSEYRRLKKPSPSRDNDISHNLDEFKKMRQGVYGEGDVCLRMKQDYLSNNPNMWDLIAYRIKFCPHYRTGNKWCIYPSYDFTHAICDSLENITHSLCTLEFETRRESYFWLLDQLNLYKPVVWEFGRLNLEYAIMSKRKNLRLIEGNVVIGWDDPRLTTLMGLKRRGYSPRVINKFCEEIGVTRNNTTTAYELLEDVCRKDLNDTAKRYFAIKDPLKLVITNLPHDHVESVTRPNIPNDPTEGDREQKFSSTMWIERSDFRIDDHKKYFGLALNGRNGNLKWVRLRYANYIIHVHDVEFDENDEPVKIMCRYDDKGEIKKTKTAIGWVDCDSSVPVEFRCYDRLFTEKDPTASENLLDAVNPKSLVTGHGMGEAAVESLPLGEGIQFERLGYYCKDQDSTPGFVVMNESVPLRVNKSKTF